MADMTPGELFRKLHEMRHEHRDLDLAIETLIANVANDEVAIKRLKKRKLLLKDQIAMLENKLIPDELA
jgi:hypothetical protein